MLSITLCNWNFLKRNKAYKSCQRVASNRKSYQKVANGLWLGLPLVALATTLSVYFCQCCAIPHLCCAIPFPCFFVFTYLILTHNQELSNFAFKTKLSFAVRCGPFRRNRFQPFLLLLLLFLSPGLENPEAEQFMHSNRYALVCEWIKIFSCSGTILVCYTAIFREQLWRPSAVLAFLNFVTNFSLSTGHTRVNSLSVLSW